VDVYEHTTQVKESLLKCNKEGPTTRETRPLFIKNKTHEKRNPQSGNLRDIVFSFSI
jgi:hypothetical protein